MENGIILIDKPKGPSSFDVIRVLRKKLGVRKMGHAGTLDPLASGLLIIGVGEATKKLQEYIVLPKTYEIEVLLGRRTATGDMEGKILEENYPEEISPEDIRRVLESLLGEVNLEAPIYSALKVRGTPMYKLAREGKSIEPKTRKMKIYDLKLDGMYKKENFNILKVGLKCGSGTYARSVAEEIGKRLGFPATVYSLRRTMVGDMDVKDAEKI